MKIMIWLCLSLSCVYVVQDQCQVSISIYILYTTEYSQTDYVYSLNLTS